tara:strand:- start:1342 stop:1680 length:339 start_codon:yes stop_codon:yes gene_type:complete
MPEDWYSADDDLRKQVLAAKWREQPLSEEVTAFTDNDYWWNPGKQGELRRNKHSIVELLQTVFAHEQWNNKDYRDFVVRLEQFLLFNLDQYLGDEIVAELDRLHENTNREVA